MKAKIGNLEVEGTPLEIVEMQRMNVSSNQMTFEKDNLITSSKQRTFEKDNLITSSNQRTFEKDNLIKPSNSFMDRDVIEKVKSDVFKQIIQSLNSILDSKIDGLVDRRIEEKLKLVRAMYVGDTTRRILKESKTYSLKKNPNESYENTNEDKPVEKLDDNVVKKSKAGRKKN